MALLEDLDQNSSFFNTEESVSSQSEGGAPSENSKKKKSSSSESLDRQEDLVRQCKSLPEESGSKDDL